jgi:hypothetical protein
MRHIGFREPVAILLRQSDTIVEYRDSHEALCLRHRHADGALHGRIGAHGNRVGGILQQVGQRLAEQAAVAGGDRAAIRNIGRPHDLGVGTAL